MIWAWHVEFRGQKQNTYRDLMRKPEERDHLVELRIDTDYIIHWIFNTTKEGVRWIDVAQDAKI